jgi:hypothetical protein
LRVARNDNIMIMMRMAKRAIMHTYILTA